MPRPLDRQLRTPLLLSTLALVLGTAACSAGTLSPGEAEGGSPAADAAGSGGADGNVPTAYPTGSAGTAADPNAATPSPANAATAQAPVPTTPSAEGVVLAVLPDYDNKAIHGLAGFVTRTGFVPKATSGYVNVGPDGAIETQTAIAYIQEAKAQKVPVISLSLTAKQKGQLTAAQLAGLAAMMAEAKTQQIQLNFRYGFEMNFGGGDGQYANINNNNDPTDFKTQWAQVAALANPQRAANPPVKMVWSPNIASGGTLPYQAWEPNNLTTIDVVAVDWYHTPGNPTDATSVTNTLQDIYAIATQLQVPFYLGETGMNGSITNAATAAEKMAWLNTLASQELRQKMPLYAGFYWFDYIKNGVNFSLSQDALALPLFKAWFPATLGKAA